MDNKNRKSGTGNITRGILPLAAGALGAGFLNGLLGAGAGIVLYFVLAAAGSRDAKENLVLSSTSVMFFCVISLFFYRDNAELTVEGQRNSKHKLPTPIREPSLILHELTYL